MMIDAELEAAIGAGCDVLVHQSTWLVPMGCLETAIRAMAPRTILGMEGFFYDPATRSLTPTMLAIADLSGLSGDESAESAVSIAREWMGAPMYVELVIGD